MRVLFLVPCAAALILLGSGPASADVTVTTTTTMTGGITDAGGAPLAARVVTRISGTRSRSDVDMGEHAATTILDTATRQGYLLRHDQKSAYLFSTDSAPTPGATSPPASPALTTAVTPTGKTREVDGVTCDEYSVALSVPLASMASAGGTALPPEAAAMLKDVTLRANGFLWAARNAPGAAEYIGYQRAMTGVAAAALSRLAAGSPGAAGGSPVPAGLEQLITGFPEAAGIPYLTELTTTIEGSGQLVALMQQMGQMKITSRVTAASTEPVPADVFVVPEGYSIVKQ